ncbi:MAG: hypothetical protein KatS3mg108_0247 [Isosphaeraceae bacterium]|nr:MAG: hypothetical protein KatS3mg108_0247 [Isosphaeraceae bacterium]
MGLLPLQRGLRHYSLHGELPNTPFWNRLEARRDLNPTPFERNHPALAGLFEKAEVPGLMPDTPYWNNLRQRYEINPARFKHYHPFLGRLIERDDRVRDSLQNPPSPPPPPITPPPPVIQPPAGGGSSGGSVNPPGGGGGSTIIPEPSSALLFAIGLLGCALLAGRRRKALNRQIPSPTPTP